MRTWSSTAGPTSAWGSSRPSRRARAGRARIATCSGFHSLRVERGARMNENGEVRIDIESFGPGPEVNDEVSEAVLDHPSVKEYLDGTRHRLLNVRLLDAEVEGKPEEPVPPDRYRATIYDYTNNRAVVATGRLDDVAGSLEVSVAGRQPIPTKDEFDEAVEVLREDEDLGPAIRERRLVPYRPMPPLVEAELDRKSTRLNSSHAN